VVNQVFVNLPVAHLQRSIAFFTALGFTFNPEWTNDSGACMNVTGNVFTMLLTREHFQTFTPKAVADATSTTEVLLCLSLDSRAAVDAIVEKAVRAGGKAHKEAQDHGFMYGHGFEDLDGHIWEVVYLAPQAGSEPKQGAA
jgi:hypothetical protein